MGGFSSPTDTAGSSWQTLLEKFLPRAAGAFFIGSLIVGILALSILADSRGVGMRLRARGDRVFVSSIWKGSPADRAGLRPGDRVVSLDGVAVQAELHVGSADRLPDWRSYDRFLASLPDPSSLPSRMEVVWEDRSGNRSATLEVIPFGWRRAASQCGPLLASAWMFSLVGWLLLRIRVDASTASVALIGSATGIGLPCLSVFLLRDLSLPSQWVPWLHLLYLPTFLVAVLGGTVMGLHFPRSIQPLDKRWWALGLAFASCLPVWVLHVSRVAPGPTWAIHIPGFLGVSFNIGTILVRWLMAKGAVRRQMRWAVLGLVLGGLLPMVLVEAPILLPGVTLLPEETHFYALIFLLPSGLAMSVKTSKLLQIESLLDKALAHTLLLVGLGFAELLFWNAIQSRGPADHITRNMILSAGMVAIVFLYAPLRLHVERWLARFAGRAIPSLAEAMQKVIENARAGLEPRLNLATTLRWALGAPGVDIRPLASLPAPVADRLGSAPRGILGQELSSSAEFADTLWIPLGPEWGSASVLVVGSHPRRAWRIDDLRLVEGVLAFAGPMVSLRTLRMERETMMSEVHDGIGGALHGIALLSRTSESDPSALRERLGTIGECATQAIESMQAGIAVLSAPPEAFGPSFVALLARNRSVATAAGGSLEEDIDDQLITLRFSTELTFRILRVVQEAIANAIRHAPGARIEVGGRLEGDHLVLEIQDGGGGFDPSVVRAGGGLSGMPARIEGAGGRFAMRSAPGEGTIVRIELPLHAAIPGVEP